MLLLSVLYLSLMTGCDQGASSGTRIDVDTSPMGVGLSVIGGGIVIAAWILAVSGGNDEDS
jgi:hypothetical protein